MDFTTYQYFERRNAKNQIIRQGSWGKNTAMVNEQNNAILDYIANNLDWLKEKLVPPGTIVSVGGSTVPEGYLLCNGAEVSQTTYAALYAQVGNSFGTATTGKFKLPNGNGVVTGAILIIKY